MKNYQTKDGLGDVYEAIARGECVCWGFSASCPIHGLKTSIYSQPEIITSTLSQSRLETRREDDPNLPAATFSLNRRDT